MGSSRDGGQRDGYGVLGVESPGLHLPQHPPRGVGFQRRLGASQCTGRTGSPPAAYATLRTQKHNFAPIFAAGLNSSCPHIFDCDFHAKNYLQVFITSRFNFDVDLNGESKVTGRQSRQELDVTLRVLGIEQLEMFQLFQRHRESLIAWFACGVFACYFYSLIIFACCIIFKSVVRTRVCNSTQSTTVQQAHGPPERGQ